MVFIDLAEAGHRVGEQVHRLLSSSPRPATPSSSRRDPKRAKVSVGSNPWARPPRAHDISSICERYGGGGHPVVGAVSLAPDRLDEARGASPREIVADAADATEPQHDPGPVHPRRRRRRRLPRGALRGARPRPATRCSRPRTARWRCTRIADEAPGDRPARPQDAGARRLGRHGADARATRRAPRCPILILSAYGFEWESELLGAQGYIPKSVGMDEILERVRKAAGPPPLRH